MGGVQRQTAAWLLLMMILALWSMNTDGQTTTTTLGTTAPPPETTTSGFQCPINYTCNESQCRDGEGCETNQKCCPVTDDCSVCVNVTTLGCDLDGGTMAEGESRPADDGCNTCTCRAGHLVCTERTCGPPCQMQVLQICYIQLFEASFFIGAADDTHYMCRSRAELDACVEQNLWACRDQLGHVKSLILGSYPKVLKVMGDLLCSMDTKTGSRAVIGNAGSCLVDFANVAVYGLTSLTCKQLAITRRCLVEATQSCSNQLKNIFSLVTSTLDTTGRTVCAPDTCNLLMAEQCINDGYVTNAAPIYRGQGSIIYCRWLKKSLTCAATHTASCSHYFEKTSESEGSMDSVEQNGATPSDISEQFDPSVFKQWVFSDKLFKEQPFENWSEDMPEVETDTESKTVLEKYLGMVQELRDAFNNVTQKQQGGEDGIEPALPASDTDKDTAEAMADLNKHLDEIQMRVRGLVQFLRTTGNNGDSQTDEENNDADMKERKKRQTETGTEGEPLSANMTASEGAEPNVNDMSQRVNSELDFLRDEAVAAEHIENVQLRLNALLGIQKKFTNLVQEYGENLFNKTVTDILSQSKQYFSGEAQEVYKVFVKRINGVRSSLGLLHGQVEKFCSDDEEENIHSAYSRSEAQQLREEENMTTRPDNTGRGGNETETAGPPGNEGEVGADSPVSQDMTREYLDKENRAKLTVLGGMLYSPFSDREQVCGMINQLDEEAKLSLPTSAGTVAGDENQDEIEIPLVGDSNTVAINGQDDTLNIEKELGDLDLGGDYTTVPIPRIFPVIAPSLAYARLVAGDMCREADLELKDCVKEEPASEPLVCSKDKAIGCVNIGEIVNMVAKAGLLGGDHHPICEFAAKAKACWAKQTAGCIFDELPEEVKAIPKRLTQLLPERFGCDLDSSIPRVCKPAPRCDAEAAVTDCFDKPSEFIDICRHTDEEVMPCVKERTSVCTSIQLTKVETRLRILLKSFENSSFAACPELPQLDIFPDDSFRPASRCMAKRTHTLYDHMKTSPSFTAAFCKATDVYVECSEDVYTPFLLELRLAKHRSFIRKFYAQNCVVKDKPENDESQPGTDGEDASQVSVPDFANCDTQLASTALLDILQDYMGLVKVHRSSQEYADRCLNRTDRLKAFRIFLTGSWRDTCSESAQRFYIDAVPFLENLTAEMCSVQPMMPPSNCSKTGVVGCLQEVAKLSGIASPSVDLCPKLSEGLQCLGQYMVSCDDQTQGMIILQELDRLESQLGDLHCNLSTWCQVTDPSTTTTQAPPLLPPAIEIPPPNVEIPFCRKMVVCDNVWEECLFKEEELCSDKMSRIAVADCIMNATKTCSPAAISLVRRKVQVFPRLMFGPDINCNLLPQSWLPDTAADVSFMDKFNTFNTMALTPYTMCQGVKELHEGIRNDTVRNGIAVDTSMNILEGHIILVDNFLGDFCPETDEFNMDGEGNTTIDGSMGNNPDNTTKGDNETVAETGDCTQLPSAEKLLKQLIIMTVTMPTQPHSQRADICHRGEELYMAVDQIVKGCTSRDSSRLQVVQRLLKSLIDTLGFCNTRDPPRDCNTKLAMACITDMATAFLAKKKHLQSSVCSKRIKVSLCIGHTMYSCPASVRKSVEESFLAVEKAADSFCPALDGALPSMTCEPADMSPMVTRCDQDGAAACMFKLHSDLLCEAPDWKNICPSIPYVTSCIERKLHNCSQAEVKDIRKMRDRMLRRVGRRCPQVDCKVCQAQRCINKLAKMDPDTEGFCKTAWAVHECVASSTKSCNPELAGHLWKQMTFVSKHIEAYCWNKVDTCFSNFTDSAWSLMLYKGPIFEEYKEPIIIIDDENITNANNNDEGNVNGAFNADTLVVGEENTDEEADFTEPCQMLSFVEEPWWDDSPINLADGHIEFKDGMADYGLKELWLTDIENGHIDAPVLSEFKNETLSVMQNDTESGPLQGGGQNVSVTDPAMQMDKCQRVRPVPLHDDLLRLCRQLFYSWKCLEQRTFMLEATVRDTVKTASFSILQLARQKCKVLPLQCHQCSKASSHSECDTAPPETCTADKQACGTIMKAGTISKGCVSPKTCQDDCTGNDCQHCCVGQLCNKGQDLSSNTTTTPSPDMKTTTSMPPVDFQCPMEEGAVCERFCDVDSDCGSGSKCCQVSPDCLKCVEMKPQEPKTPTCHLYTQMYCSLNLVRILARQDKPDCQVVKETMECLSNISTDCLNTYDGQLVQLYASQLRKTRAWDLCARRERNCYCGGYHVMAFSRVLNPYTSIDTICRHYSSVDNFAKLTDWRKCTKEDQSVVKQSLDFGKYYIGEHSCTAEDVGTKASDRCPPVGEMMGICVEACSSKDNCTNGQICCSNGCGHTCQDPIAQEEPAEEDDNIFDCGPGVPVTRCLVAPCQVTSCTKYSNATCRDVYCGGCLAVFYDNNEDVSPFCNIMNNPAPQPGMNPQCKEPMKVGYCQGKQLYWFFNSESGRCEEFTYTGCGGSANRFRIEADCNTNCRNDTVIETECSEVEEKHTKHLTRFVGRFQVLPKPAICSVAVQELYAPSKAILGKCGNATRRHNLWNKISDTMGFNMTECDSYINNGKWREETGETTACPSVENLKTACPSLNDLSTCVIAQEALDCVNNLTKSCHPAVPKMEYLELVSFAQLTNLRSCDFKLPQYWTPVFGCLHKFREGFLVGLGTQWLSKGASSLVCQSISDAKLCLTNILGLTHQYKVSKIFTLISQLETKMCNATSKAETGEVTPAMQCYSCHRATSNEECNNQTEICIFSQQACEVTTITTKEGSIISKGCKNPVAVRAREKCHLNKKGIRCTYGCQGNLCNGEMFGGETASEDQPMDDGSVTGGETPQQTPVVTICNDNIGKIDNMMIRIFSSYFLPYSQLQSRCRDIQDQSFSTNVDCGSEVIGRVEEIGALMKTAGTMVCPAPKPIPADCKAEQAMDTLSQLGVALATCHKSTQIQLHVCNSVAAVMFSIKAMIAKCPDGAVTAMYVTIKDMQTLVDRVCGSGATSVPDHPVITFPTPSCLPPEYNAAVQTCQAGKALLCLSHMGNEIFSELGSDARFCSKMRDTVRCYIDNTNGCGPVLAALINPAMQLLLNDFHGRCDSVWCPVEEEEEECNIDVANACANKLRNSITLKDGKACGMVGSVEECIRKATVKCSGKNYLLLKKIVESVKMMSAVACIPPPVVIIDPTGCIEHFKTMADKLVSINITDITLQVEKELNITIEVEDDFDEADAPVDDEVAPDDEELDDLGEADNRRKRSAPSHKKAKKGSKRLTRKSSTKTKHSRSLYIDITKELVEEKIVTLCDEVEYSFNCVQDVLAVMEPRNKGFAQLLIDAIWDAVTDVCKPMRCFSCSGLGDNGACNSQTLQVCTTQQQMCYSKYDVDLGTYKKGCASEDACIKDCLGKQGCYCCKGHKCNVDGFVEEPMICEIKPAIECSYNLFHTAVKADSLVLGALSKDIECVMSHTKDCKSSNFQGLYVVCEVVVGMFQTRQCISQYGNPMCGVPATLSLTYMMNNPYRYKPSVCDMYQTTASLALNAELCSEKDHKLHETSLARARQQLAGFCTPPTAEPRVCNVTKAIEDCVTKKTWRRGVSECTDTMYAAFRNCCIQHTVGCTSPERAPLFIPVNEHLDQSKAACIAPVTTNLTAILQAIFPTDEISSITSQMTEFALSVGASMVNSLNPPEDICKSLAHLKEKLTDDQVVSSSTLDKALAGSSTQLMLDNLADICKNTTITADTIEEVCSQKELDIVIIMDGSGSIQAKEFPEMIKFVKNVVNLADLESGAVRMGLLQFGSEVRPILNINESMVPGETYQNKTLILETLDNTRQIFKSTETGKAIAAALEFTTPELGGREGVKKHFILVTDGESTNPDHTQEQAAKAKKAGVYIFAVGIRMDTQDQIFELNTIASPPASQNVLRLAQFTQLDEIYRKIFLLFCRMESISNCNYSDIVHTSTDALVLGMANPYSSVQNKNQICSVVNQRTSTITEVSASCTAYEKSLLQISQSMISTLSFSTCIKFDYSEPTPACNKDNVKFCLKDLAMFLRWSHIEDKHVCRKLKETKTCLDYYLADCTDTSILLAELTPLTAKAVNRCPKEVAALRCWLPAGAVGDTPTVVVEEAPPVDCNVVSIVSDCIGSISWVSVFPPSCEKFLLKINETIHCVAEAFMSTKCPRLLLPELQQALWQPGTAMYDTVSLLCDLKPVEVTLPDDYGVEVVPPCAAADLCKGDAALKCLDLLTDSTEECGPEEFYTCVDDNTKGCSSTAKHGLKIQLEYAMTYTQNFPQACVDRIQVVDTPYTACLNDFVNAVAVDSNTLLSMCDALQEFNNCLTDPDLPVYEQALLEQQHKALVELHTEYCASKEDIPAGEGNETCTDVPAADIKCIMGHFKMAAYGPLLLQPSQRLLCESSGAREECAASLDRNCPRQSKQGRAHLVHTLTEILIDTGDVCAVDVSMCSINSGLACASALGQAVSHYDFSSSNDTDICQKLSDTESCLNLTLSDCWIEQRRYVIDTFEQIQCLALDACPSGKPKPLPEVGDPDTCVDTETRREGAHCSLPTALRCLRKFNSFSRSLYINKRHKCKAYSDTLHCVMDNQYGCTALERAAVQLKLATAQKIAKRNKCVTELTSTCIEPVDCGVKKARNCLTVFNENLQHFKELGTVCTQLNAVKTCIEQSVGLCTASARSEVDKKFEDLVANLDVKCTDDFYGCAKDFTYFLNKILTWKSVIVVEVDTSSKKKKKSKKSVQIVSVDATREQEFNAMCVQFSQAWQCVESSWSILPTETLKLVKSAFSAYHQYIQDICRGPKPGYCKKRSKTPGSKSVDDCLTDSDCQTSRKCCAYGGSHLCLTPEPHNTQCFTSVVSSSTTIFNIISSLYTAKDRGLQFCTLYTASQSTLLTQGLLESCPEEYFSSIQVAWQACDLASTAYCLVPPEPPKPCTLETGRVCINTYETAATDKTNNQRCLLYKELELCIQTWQRDCDSGVSSQKVIIDAIDVMVLKVKNSLTCVTFPEFQLSVPDGQLVVVEGEFGTTIGVRLQQDPSEICPGDSCEILIEQDLIQDEKKMAKCGRRKKSITQLLIGNYCSMTFTSQDWNVMKNFSVAARLDRKKDEDFPATFKLTATLIVNGKAIQSSPVKNYQILVKDREPNTECKSVNDPHMTSFDGTKFDMMKQGIFVLYKHKFLPYEVRIMTTFCNPKRKKAASCNCGVYVRCGDDVFVINRCYNRGDPRIRPPTLWKNGDLFEGFKIYSSDKGKVYRVMFPTGTYVEVKITKGKKKKKKNKEEIDYLNVFVSPSSADVGNVEGLCGNCDNSTKNDFMCSDGTVKAAKKDFISCWTVAPEDYELDGVPANNDKNLEGFCRQDGEQCVCDLSDLVETCELSQADEVTTTISVGNVQTRKKRATGDPLLGMNFDIAADPPDLVFPTASGITQADAETHCNTAIRTADFIQPCLDNNILEEADLVTAVEGCLEDIKATDELQNDFLEQTLEALRTQCSLAAASGTDTTLVENILTVTCPNGCSGQGDCSNGTCTCNAGFRGEDCSIDLAVPPETSGLVMNNCIQTQTSGCETVVVEGDNFVDGAVCHYDVVKLNESGTFKIGKLQQVAAQVDSFERVTCDVTGVGRLPEVTVLVSVSNNGMVTSQSEQYLYIAHNPICLDCTITNQTTGTCKKQRASCLVNDVCYRPLDPGVNDPCYVCDVYSGDLIYMTSPNCPELSTTTPASTTEAMGHNQESVKMNDTTVIGLSAGIAVLLLLVIITIVGIMVFKIRQKNLSRQAADGRDLTRRSRSSHQSDESKDDFGETVYPAFANYGYYGYGPANYLEAPAEYFVEGIPKRHSSKRPDPTRSDDKHDDRRRERRNRDSSHI